MVKGTGSSGIITKEDVLNTIKKFEIKTIEPEVAKIIPVTGAREVIAERLTKSYQTAPHITITMESDITETEILSRS